MSEPIRPWDTLAFCRDVKQPTNKQTNPPRMPTPILSFFSPRLSLSSFSHCHCVCWPSPPPHPFFFTPSPPPPPQYTLCCLVRVLFSCLGSHDAKRCLIHTRNVWIYVISRVCAELSNQFLWYLPCLQTPLVSNILFTLSDLDLALRSQGQFTTNPLASFYCTHFNWSGWNVVWRWNNSSWTSWYVLLLS